MPIDEFDDTDDPDAEISMDEVVQKMSGGVVEAFGSMPEKPYTRDTPKIGRNDPCFCGSGKKFKRCHGKT